MAICVSGGFLISKVIGVKVISASALKTSSFSPYSWFYWKENEKLTNFLGHFSEKDLRDSMAQVTPSLKERAATPQSLTVARCLYPHNDATTILKSRTISLKYIQQNFRYEHVILCYMLWLVLIQLFFPVANAIQKLRTV